MCFPSRVGVYSTAVTEAVHKSGIKLKIYTSYLALTGELRGAYCEDLGEIDRVMTTLHSPSGEYTDVTSCNKSMFHA